MEYTKIIPGYRTDHYAIVFSFSISPANRGKGYLKFNFQLLRDSALKYHQHLEIEALSRKFFF
jgi:hypothetical protein